MRKKWVTCSKCNYCYYDQGWECYLGKMGTDGAFDKRICEDFKPRNQKLEEIKNETYD